MCLPTTEQIKQALVAYLTMHPTAQDTLEGIVEWWVLEQQVMNQTSQILEAVSDLVESGILIKIENTDSSVRYKVNRQMLARLQRAN